MDFRAHRPNKQLGRSERSLVSIATDLTRFLTKTQRSLTFDTLRLASRQREALAHILVEFAYSTNGHGIIEFDYLTGQEQPLSAFPTPDELWDRVRHQQSLRDEGASRLLTPSYHLSGSTPLLAASA